MKKQFEALLKVCPVIAILRGITPQEVEPVCDALFQAGIRLLEIPMNSPEACKSIAIAVKHCGDRQMVGAGTVLSRQDVIDVANAGGKFIISPNTDAEVIRQSKESGLLSIPGIFTASEGFSAIQAGADFLKLFPAILGPEYVRDLKAVIKIPILAVGGVNVENIAAFLKVCCGAGIGSALYKAGKSIEDVAGDARTIVAAAQKGQNPDK